MPCASGGTCWSWHRRAHPPPLALSSSPLLPLLCLVGLQSPVAFGFQPQCPCGLVMGLSGSSPSPRAALSAVFHELPSFTELKENRALSRPACREALVHSLEDHVPDLPDFSAGGVGGWVSAGFRGGSSGCLCFTTEERARLASSSPISQMSKLRLRSQVQ